jgi:hypothetical protein
MLDFGAVFPGVPAVVSRTDAARSGQFDLRGANQAEVSVTLTLPAALVGPGGQTVPLQFGADDGGYAQNNTIGAATAFDPRTPLVTRLSVSGRLFIWLGGMALPSPTQPSGDYTATITLVAAYTGN